MKFIYLNFVLMPLIFSVFGDDEDTWKDVRVTYAKDKNNPHAFNKLPLTRKDAIDAGYQQVGGEDAKCDGIGYKYILNNDPAVVPIYNERGYISGFQSGFKESQMVNDKVKAWFKEQPMFTIKHPEYNKSETIYNLRVYFQDPDHVCDTKHKWERKFYYMNGTTKIFVPMELSKLDKKQWVEGKCRDASGTRYLYKISQHMKCSHFQPFFLMFDHGKLIGFSFLAFGQYSSPHYGPDEYHTKDTYSVPDCLKDDDCGVTTLHGYMIEEPWLIKC